MSEYDIKNDPLNYIKPIVKTARPNVEIPAAIAKIMRDYMEAHREDILDEINDFGGLKTLLFWFDNYMNFRAEPVEYVYIQPLTWIGKDEDLQATLENLELPRINPDEFKREYFGDWSPVMTKEEIKLAEELPGGLQKCSHCGCVHGAHNQDCAGLSGGAL